MNNIQEISFNSNKDDPWYTISSAMKIEAKYIRQTSSMDCFAKVKLEVKPYYNPQITIFNNQIAKIHLGNKVLYPLKNSNLDTIETSNIIVEGIIKGIKKACLDLTKKSYLIGGIEVIATSAMFHLVDSRSQCYEMAVYLGLLEVFEKVNSIEI